MAYPSTWVDKGYYDVFNNGAYSVGVQWSYRQDPIANKTQIAFTAMRIASVNSAYSMSSLSNTFGVCKADGTSAQGTTTNCTCSYGSTWNWGLPTHIYSEFSHNSNGSIGAITAGKYKWNTNYTNASYYKFPQVSSYTNFSIASGNIASIDRSAGSATMTYSSKGKNSITWTYKPTVATDVVQYSTDGTNWTNASPASLAANTSQSYTLSGLKPNTSYTIRMRHRRTYNQVYSGAYSITQTTTAPSAPTVGTVTASEIKLNSAKISWSGFTVDSASGLARYDLTTNGGSSYTSMGTNTSYTVTGLTHSTTYTNKIGIRVVDNNSQASSVKYVNFTTASPAKPTAGTVTASNITVNSATISWSGATKDSTATITRYELTKDGGSSYTSQGTNTSASVTGLTHSTAYTNKIGVRVVDSYGQTSATVYANFTTASPAKPTVGTVTNSDITINSVKLSWSGSTKDNTATISRYEVTKDAGANYTNVGNVSSYTITSLTPQTAYTNKVGVRVVDSYSQYSTVVYSNFTTATPKSPTTGTVTASDVTINSAKISWSGFAVAESTASIVRYEITTDGGTNYTSVGNVSSYTVTGLTPETVYTNKIGVRVVDSYGKISNTVYINFMTLSDQSKVKINIGGVTKVGKVFYNLNGTAKKVTAIYVNVNGTAKKAL